ncbi:MAG: FAD-dependent oxidoreductase, partial [Parvibaculum sp.]
ECATRNTARKVRLCTYSQSVLHETVAATGVAYDGRRGGLLYFYRDPKAFEAAVARSRVLSDNGCDVTALDRDGVVAADPALAPVRERIAGAIYGRADESGDCRKFARGLAAWLQDKGVSFKFGSSVTGFETRAGRIEAVVTDQGPVSADGYVLCLGVYSPHVARQLGAKLPIYPVKGYSVTLPAPEGNAPEVSITDEARKIVISRLGGRLRAAGQAEVGGYDLTLEPARANSVLDALTSLLPQVAPRAGQAEFWCGLRPMTPDGSPVIGRLEPLSNLFINSGHGTLGWTLGAGSATLLADLICGGLPQLDVSPFSITRF